MRLAAILVTLLATACATPVTKEQWQRCEAVCAERKGVKEACKEMLRGPGCHCGDDVVIWLDDLAPKAP